MTIFHKQNHIATDCLLILFITAVIYLPLLGIPAWDGNEPLRVIVANHMLKTDAWMIPILHGKPYFSKPPLMNWLIAASGSFFGIVNEWTSRLPSVVVVFLTGISIYFLTKKWLGREGSLFAAIATLSTVELIEKGRTAEIDSLFIFFVVFILLIWINGYLRQWNPLLIWGLCLALSSIAFLTKGPQAFAYFYLTVFAYLLIKKKLFFFFSKSHLFGVLCFILVLAVYLFFVLQKVSLQEYIHIWAGEITQRASTRRFSFFEHLFQYPFRAILAFMPWTLFLFPVFFHKGLKDKIREVFTNEIVVFALVMVLANFPLYWLLPNARVRYFLPAGPFLAIIVAALMNFYLKISEEKTDVESFLRKGMKILLWIVMLSVLLMPAVVLYMKLYFSPTFIVLYICFILLIPQALFRHRSIRIKTFHLYIALITGLFFIIYTELDLQNDLKRTYYPKKVASDISRLLPNDVQTVYVVGYRRVLGIICYVNKDFIQLDRFDQLQSVANNNSGKTFFIFDMDFLNSINDADRKAFLQNIKWEKVYSQYLEKSRQEIIVGYLL